MPPVPKVILAGPGATQPWPSSDACWSPAMPAMGGAPGRAVAGPSTPVESTMVGSIERGMRELLEDPVVPVTPVEVDQAGDRGVGQVGHVQLAARQLPGDPRVGRAEAQVAGPVGVVGVEQPGRPWWPTGSGPAAGPRPASTRHSPTVRRSCQPSAGPDRLAGGPVPHDRRGPLVGDADGVDRTGLGQRPAGQLDSGVGQHVGVELDQPGGGGVGQRSHGGARSPPWRPGGSRRSARCWCRRR